jgi:hypothetical protein
MVTTEFIQTLGTPQAHKPVSKPSVQSPTMSMDEIIVGFRSRLRNSPFFQSNAIISAAMGSPATPRKARPTTEPKNNPSTLNKSTHKFSPVRGPVTVKTTIIVAANTDRAYMDFHIK